MGAGRRFAQCWRRNWAPSKGDTAAIAGARHLVLMALVALQAGKMPQQYVAIDWGIQ